jgi:Family of unknown function (DUF5372)
MPSNSINTAASSDVAQEFVEVTHPFHPLSGRRLSCVGRRYNRYGERVLLQDEKGGLWLLPPQWTDLVVPDPVVALSDGRALLRFVDLMELARLVDRLTKKMTV